MNNIKKSILVRRCAVSGSILVLVLLVIHFVQYETLSSISAGNSYKDNCVPYVFMIDGMAYYIQTDGDMFLYEESNNSFVHTFPTHVVRWAECLNGFIYIDDGSIRVYDPEINSDSLIFSIAKIYNNQKPCYVISVSPEYVYFRCGAKNYKLNIENKKIDMITLPIHNQVYESDDYLVFQSSDYQDIYIFDLNTNREIGTFHEESVDPVVSATIHNDMLIYVRSDGLLRYVDYSAGGNRLQPKIGDLNLERKVLAVASSGQSIICVIGITQDNICSTAVVELSGDGAVDLICEAGEPNYVVPGSCKLCADSSSYIFGVADSEIVSWGRLD